MSRPGNYFDTSACTADVGTAVSDSPFTSSNVPYPTPVYTDVHMFDVPFGGFDSAPLGGGICSTDIDAFFRDLNDLPNAVDAIPDDSTIFQTTPFEGPQEDSTFFSMDGTSWLCDSESH